MGVSIGTGLASGIDYTTLISGLMDIEARPQALLATQLTTTQTQAAAYRSINTTFASLVTAATALTGTNFTAARSASSTNSAVTATATSTATVGSSLTFSVESLAAAHTVISNTEWTSATGDVRTAVASGATAPGWPMEIVNTTTGATIGTIDLPADASLADAAAAINKGGFGLSASVVQLGTDRYRLQVTSTATGAAGDFYLKSADEDSTNAGTGYTVDTQGSDATLRLNSGLTASSATNTFNELITGVSVTVSKADPTTQTTIAVKSDTAAITAKVQSLVTAANNVLTAIKTNTSSATGSTAALKGNYSLASLSNSVLNAVSSAVGSDGSAAKAGVQLTRDGLLTFDATAFQTALADDPDLVQRIFSGATGEGADNVRGTADDTLVTDGLGARLQRLAQQANDSVTGTLTTLASGQDTRAKDLQTQIDAWTDRLASRKAALTSQFNALETALGSLQNQSTWLTSQLAALPSWSSSDS